ncbi:MAG: PH domain-containing protein, partial [archaeon]|nr:PH domain-containing protein [archaeon]
FVRAVIYTLLELIEERPPTKSIEEFDEHFKIGRDIPERMMGFLSSLGGLESNTVRILSVCNQAATAAAVIELKTTLGFSNATTDMLNTWHFVINISADRIEVINTKREQSMQRTFEFEWEFVTLFQRRPLVCTEVTLTVTDLVFSQNVGTPQMYDVSSRLQPIMRPSLRDELAKSNCFSPETSIPRSPTPVSHIRSSSRELSYTRTGYMRKVGGNRKKPGNWQQRWFGLCEDGCLYYFKNPPSGKKVARPAGAIDLRLLQVLGPVDEQTKKLNTFKLQLPERTYYFQTTTFSDMQDWAKAIAAYAPTASEIDATFQQPAPPAAAASSSHTLSPLADLGRRAKLASTKKKTSTWSKSLFGVRRAKIGGGLFIEEGCASSVVTETEQSEDSADPPPFPGVFLRTDSPATQEQHLSPLSNSNSLDSASPRRTPTRKVRTSRKSLEPGGHRVIKKQSNTLDKHVFSELVPRRMDRSGSIDSRSHQHIPKDLCASSSPEPEMCVEAEIASLRSRNSKLSRQLKQAKEANKDLIRTIEELQSQIEKLNQTQDA